MAELPPDDNDAFELARAEIEAELEAEKQANAEKFREMEAAGEIKRDQKGKFVKGMKRPPGSGRKRLAKLGAKEERDRWSKAVSSGMPRMIVAMVKEAEKGNVAAFKALADRVWAPLSQDAALQQELDGLRLIVQRLIENGGAVKKKPNGSAETSMHGTQ